MIKFDNSNEKNDGDVVLKIAGTPMDLALEVAALALSVRDKIEEYNDNDAKLFTLQLMHNLMIGFEDDREERKKMVEEHNKHMEVLTKLMGLEEYLKSLKNDLENEDKVTDIRRSEFDSDEEFEKWFHGGEKDV